MKPIEFSPNSGYCTQIPEVYPNKTVVFECTEVRTAFRFVAARPPGSYLNSTLQ
jgi:hypothetical protein